MLIILGEGGKGDSLVVVEGVGGCNIGSVTRLVSAVCVWEFS